VKTFYFGVYPIAWSSKLQTQVALPTTEREYIALSPATPDILPLCQVLADIDTLSFVTLLKQAISTIKIGTLHPSHIYEDNTRCILSAMTQANFKHRTNHIALNWHYFKDHQEAYGSLITIKVGIDTIIVGTFTKPLVKCKFEHLESMLMG
jgi:hypothetical protein